jgi:hypothetical protein
VLAINPPAAESFQLWNPHARAELLGREVRNMPDEAAFDYERADIESGGVAWLSAGLALFVVATPLLMPLVFPQSMQHRTPSAPPALSADAPGLEISPRETLSNFDRGQAEFASGYRWADRSRGIVRIPVRRAMELIALRGLEGWPKP